MREAQREAGQRLAQDLRRIREKKGVSLETIEEATKVRTEQIEAFEKDALVGAGQSNRIYVRSFIRQYASLIEVDEEQALAALDAAQRGVYDGELVSGKPIKPDATVPAATEVQTTALPTPASSSAPEKKQSSEAPQKAPTPKAAAPPPAISAPPKPEVSAQASPVQAAPKLAAAAKRQEVRRGRDERRRSSTGGSFLLALGVMLVVAVLAVFVGPMLLENTAFEPEPSPPPVEEAEEALPPPMELPEPMVLGDSLTVQVVAISEDGVQAMGIRPTFGTERFWINSGDTLTVSMTQQLTLENQLDEIRVLVEGYEYPVSRRETNTRLVLTREGIQAYLDSLATGGMGLPR